MKIIELINKHDLYYAMSDDRRAYESGKAEESEIRRLLKDYSPDDILPLITDEVRQNRIKTFFS